MSISSTVSELRMQTGLRIRRERILWGMTQEQLSDVLGVSANYLGQIERGNRDLSRKMEDRLCSLFHLDRNELHSAARKNYCDRVHESDLLMPNLQEDEIFRMLNSCSAEELHLCGHVLRSMLMYLRRSSLTAQDIPSVNLMQTAQPSAEEEIPAAEGEASGVTVEVSGLQGEVSAAEFESATDPEPGPTM